MDDDRVEEELSQSTPTEPADGRHHYRFLTNTPNFEEENEEKKALDFNESDPTFRVFICNYPVAPVFFILSIVKLLLLLAALLFTIAQLILHSTSTTAISAGDGSASFNFSYSTWNSNSNPTPTSRTPKTLTENEGRWSWASAIFYFEPSWWLTLAYLRLTVAVVAMFSVLCGLFGLWRQRRRFLLATAAADCGLVLFLLGYLALLAWHAVKYDDYFAFCIGGLTLLCLLLISVIGLHAAVVSHKYLRSMQSFLTAAKNRWPDAYDEAIRVARQRSSERRGGFCSIFYHRLTRRYAVVRELQRATAAELTVMNRGKTVLHDIEEGDGEESEEEQRTS